MSYVRIVTVSLLAVPVPGLHLSSSKTQIHILQDNLVQSRGGGVSLPPFTFLDFRRDLLVSLSLIVKGIFETPADAT